MKPQARRMQESAAAGQPLIVRILNDFYLL